VFVGKGKDGDCLDPFFQSLKRSKVQIKAVAMDMGKAYIAATQHYLPDTPIVFDHFHVVKVVNGKLDELRRYVMHQAQQLGLPVTKGLRWVILKNPEHLTEKQKPMLAQLLALNSPLTKAYLLKEQLRSFWDFATKEQATTFLQQWLIEVRSLDLAIMNSLANTIESHLYGLLAYFDHRISSGIIEGLNNKISTLLKRSYGLRDLDYFMLKVKAIHSSRYALLG
jgi:transposase